MNNTGGQFLSGNEHDNNDVGSLTSDITEVNDSFETVIPTSRSSSDHTYKSLGYEINLDDPDGSNREIRFFKDGTLFHRQFEVQYDDDNDLVKSRRHITHFGLNNRFGGLQTVWKSFLTSRI